MEKAKLELKAINDILKESFLVPPYQRGYRWTNRQVSELLNDIWEFRINSETRSKNVFYCLQPIVVSKKNDEWELVDGQQRLTTIYLILYYLKEGLTFLGKENYTIHYETRPNSWEFLQSIDLRRSNENIDYHFICEAYIAIDKWFKTKDGTVKINFLITLLNDNESGKNVKVIWYDISDESTDSYNPVDVFTRINIGKIPLTNAELIKALFLGKIKGDDANDNRINLKRLQIASEWDRIEYTLQNDSFWYFIYGNNKTYDTRIEYIFDLMKEKPDDAEDYYTFHKFNEEFEESDIDSIWLSIKRVFQTFEEWFSNRRLYHLIGFLISTGYSIALLKTESEQKTKTEFKSLLIEKIKKKINFNIDDLEYGDKRLRPLFLLFNIQTMLTNEKANIRFPFDSYKKENWDIEHIRSVQSEKPTGNNQSKWLEIIIEYFTGTHNTEEQLQNINDLEQAEKELAKEILKLLQNDKILEADFTPIYEKLLKYFKEDTDPENINSISNLALLDAGTNRSYKNAPFPIKRKIIFQKDKEGSFIPLCTKNVFLKAYSKKFENVMFWQESDANEYLSEIKKTLSIYIPEQNIGGNNEK